MSKIVSTSGGTPVLYTRKEIDKLRASTSVHKEDSSVRWEKKERKIDADLVFLIFFLLSVIIVIVIVIVIIFFIFKKHTLEKR